MNTAPQPPAPPCGSRPGAAAAGSGWRQRGVESTNAAGRPLRAGRWGHTPAGPRPAEQKAKNRSPAVFVPSSFLTLMTKNITVLVPLGSERNQDWFAANVCENRFPGNCDRASGSAPAVPTHTRGVRGGGGRGRRAGIGEAERSGAGEGGVGLGRVEVGGGRRKEAGSQDAPSLPRGLTPRPLTEPPRGLPGAVGQV